MIDDAAIGYFESGATTLDYARRVDDFIESLNARISEARALGSLKGFPWEDWIDFKRAWGTFRDEVFDAWVTWGMYDTIQNYHRQAQAWQKLFNKLSNTKTLTPQIPYEVDESEKSGVGLGTIAVVGGLALAAGLLWNRSKRS